MGKKLEIWICIINTSSGFTATKWQNTPSGLVCVESAAPFPFVRARNVSSAKRQLAQRGMESVWLPAA
jgi:hypothetical protein